MVNGSTARLIADDPGQGRTREGASADDAERHTRETATLGADGAPRLPVEFWETGGTIGCNPTLRGAKVGKLSRIVGGEVLKRIKGQKIRTIARVDSSQMSPQVWSTMLVKLGLTDPLCRKRVIFTAAHTPAGIEGSDAEANIAWAVELAHRSTLPADVYIAIAPDVIDGGTAFKIDTSPERSGSYITGAEVKGQGETRDATSATVVTHGSDTLALTAFVARLAVKMQGRIECTFGDVDLIEWGPTSSVDRLEQRLAARRDRTGHAQGVVITGPISDTDLEALCRACARLESLGVVCSAEPKPSAYANLIFVDHEPAKVHAKLALLVGQTDVSRSELTDLMSTDVAGERHRLDCHRGAIRQHDVVVRAAPGLDARLIRDCAAEVPDGGRLVLAGYGDGNFPFERRCALLERFTDYVSSSTFDDLSQSDASTAELAAQLIEALDGADPASVFKNVLREDAVIDAIIAAQESGIEVVLGSQIPSVVPNPLKYEPGCILVELLGCKTLDAPLYIRGAIPGSHARTRSAPLTSVPGST